jgi:hypothetical protein
VRGEPGGAGSRHDSAATAQGRQHLRPAPVERRSHQLLVRDGDVRRLHHDRQRPPAEPAAVADPVRDRALVVPTSRLAARAPSTRR